MDGHQYAKQYAKKIFRMRVARTLSGYLLVLVYLLVRATILWLGALLVDLPSFGLPAITWLQAVGIVAVVRAALTSVTAVHIVQEPSPTRTSSNPMMDVMGALSSLAQSLPQQQQQEPENQ